MVGGLKCDITLSLFSEPNIEDICSEVDQVVELSPDSPDTFDVEPVSNQNRLLDERCRKFPRSNNLFSITPTFDGAYTLRDLAFRVVSVRSLSVSVVSRTKYGYYVERIRVSTSFGFFLNTMDQS